MLKVLFNKQLKEFKYSYFVNKKTGKIRPKKEIVPRLILYVFIYIALLFSIFCLTMGISMFVNTKENIWIMFAIITFITVFASTFINMLITRGILFEAKDNELMLSLPLPDHYIVLSRMLNVFLNTIIYTFMLWAPTFIYYFIFIGFDILVLIYGTILFILITFIVVALSCLFGYGISLLLKKIRVKNLFQTLITLVFLAVYYVVYFNASNIMKAMLADIPKFEAVMKTKGIFIYAFAKAATGDTLYLLISLAFTLIICVVCFVLIIRRYRNLLVTSPVTVKKEFKGRYSKVNNVKKALVKRELKMFFSHSTYTINCGLGVVILLAASVALVIFNGQIREFSEIIKEVPFFEESLPIVLLAAISLIVSLDALSVPAVSLEGKNYWIVRTLPVSTYDVLNSKRILQTRMHIIPVAILSVLCSMFFEMEDITQIAFVLCTCMACAFIAYCDLFLGIKGANLKWTDAVFVIKQSGSVAIAVFGGMIIFGGLGALYILVLENYISVTEFMFILIAIFVILSSVIDKWIKTKGVKEFEELG